MKTIIISAVTAAVTAIVASFCVYAFVPVSWFDALSFEQPNFGTSITTIAGSDTLSSSRTTINDNFSNLNSGKAELTSANTFTALNTFTNATSSKFSCYGPCYFGGSATSSFAETGALTLITPLTVPNGGTASTTLSANQVLLGNGSSAITTVSGWGSSGQALASNGGVLAPTWQSISFDTAANYALSGNWNFTGTTRIKLLNASSTVVFNGVSYTYPSSLLASSSALLVDGSGNQTWEPIFTGKIVRVSGAETSTSDNASTTITSVTIPAGTFITTRRMHINGLFSATGGASGCSFDIGFGSGSATTTLGSVFDGGNGGAMIDVYGYATSTANSMFVGSGFPIGGTGANTKSTAPYDLTATTYVSFNAKDLTGSTCYNNGSSIEFLSAQ